ncbi:hypothetical protein L211DRAFT_842539 [Terfezia boudieri ATCC MYA-4762]|uniref:Uncharacterized protein n=1 Tax=Terfezia boudieri ATCC MYA-4762 TaxID=1051890 RepID=A0A3N4L974_9PEZI|nr:hypothetical protein L211DRAFT_842539 [Terfezia boudieri ATCC MYA-4762]
MNISPELSRTRFYCGKGLRLSQISVPELGLCLCVPALVTLVYLHKTPFNSNAAHLTVKKLVPSGGGKCATGVGIEIEGWVKH